MEGTNKAVASADTPYHIDGFQAPTHLQLLEQPQQRGSVSDASTTVAGSCRDSFEDEEQFSPTTSASSSAPYPSDRSRRPLLARFFGAIVGAGSGSQARRNRQVAENDYFGVAMDGKGLLKTMTASTSRRRSRVSPPREVRRYRRSYVGGCLKRAVVALPVVLLALLGLLHIAEFLLGRTSLLWDLSAYDEYLPDWGLPGHEGEGLAGYPTDATRDVVPIPCHSHNDYWRRVPLFDAIHWGCTGVEADVWLFDEELYVGHSTAALTKNRTFRNLYVNPLVDLLDQMNPNSSFADVKGHGVFDADPAQSLVLLIDFKTNGRDTYPFVQQQLSALRDRNYLTYWDGQTVHQRAVTVVGTGNTPFDLIVANTTYRDIFFDAPLDHLWEHPTAKGPAPRGANVAQSSIEATPSPSPSSLDEYNPSTSYYASVSFTHAIGFIWRGRLSAKQLDLLRGQIRGAHRRGLKARYWNTPSWPVSLRNHVWHVLMQEGADVLNVDDLHAAAVENWKVRNRGVW